MKLTVTEKEKWVTIISSRIDEKIARIIAEKDPKLHERIQKEAEKETLVRLDVVEEQKKLASLLKKAEALAQVVLETLHAQRVKLGYAASDPYQSYYSYASSKPIVVNSSKFGVESLYPCYNSKLAKIKAELKAASVVGPEIAVLENEKRTLTETIWLASSDTQMKTLWNAVNDLLGNEASGLEKIALGLME